MGWIIGIILILFIILCVYLDYHLGRRMHINTYKENKYPKRQGEIQLITNGMDLFHALFSDLKQAKSSIQVQFYIVQNDLLSRTFFTILEEQAKRGVKIHVILDWLGSRTVPCKWIKSARKHGIEFAFCHKPKWPFPFYTLQQRNHRKSTIIDGKIGYLGGYNIGMEYIDQDPKLSPWRDYHIRIKGEGVLDLQQEFIVDWRKATGKNMQKSKGSMVKEGEIKYQIYPSQGVGLDKKWVQLLKEANHSILIGTPYFIPPPNLFSELKKALKRGVELKILVPNKADHPIVKEASFPYLRKLLSLGASIYQFEKGFFHGKVVIIDQRLCSIGTANFDYRSFFLNNEMTCFIYDQHLITHVQAIVEKDIQQSELLTLERLNQIGLFMRIKEGMGWIFKGLL
ncbi:cardiolipin synthase [Lederbergia sp. NSJ-179]|uniref:cardiolipin synthase n=1 Tax=Lederbergia sp. NSJ-179 TaxID=2931402 RepID=UPI001FD242E4|nr:cardiolipin synthase [Lederbergia sp. NSJ-179]MCJ7841591.1 cardiolipin synthase [Lederbergia sp. NSJ-179]